MEGSKCEDLGNQTKTHILLAGTLGSSNKPITYIESKIVKDHDDVTKPPQISNSNKTQKCI